MPSNGLRVVMHLDHFKFVFVDMLLFIYIWNLEFSKSSMQLEALNSHVSVDSTIEGSILYFYTGLGLPRL